MIRMFDAKMSIFRTPNNDEGANPQEEEKMTAAQKVIKEYEESKPLGKGHNDVSDMERGDKKRAKKHGKVIRDAQIGRGVSDRELDAVDSFFEKTTQDANQQLRDLDEETKDMSAEERDKYALENFKKEASGLQSEIDDATREYIKENKGQLAMAGGSGGSGGNPQDGGGISELQQTLERIRALNEQARADNERKQDQAVLQQAIITGMAAGLAAEATGAPFDMIIAGLEAIQQEEGIDLRIFIGVLEGLKTVAKAPANAIKFFTLRTEREIGEKYNDKEFLAMVEQEEKEFFKGKKGANPFASKAAKDASDDNLLYTDPDKDGRSGDDGLASGNFVVGEVGGRRPTPINDIDRDTGPSRQ